MRESETGGRKRDRERGGEGGVRRKDMDSGERLRIES